MSDVNFALNLPPEKAIAFLQEKGAIVKHINAKALKDSARAKATRIANLSSLEMTKDIYQSLAAAQEKGLSFGQWKKEIFEHFKRKGWIAGYDKEYLLADPNTGEFFGTPRRLENIFRTNMQSAYSAQRYQQMRDNVDNRPYWQYSAILDDRTRPSHSAMNHLVYRYDDPFWNVFYPPNGFNCRCSVIALSERDIKQQKLVVGESKNRLVDYVRKVNATLNEKTTAFKLSEEKWLITDRGFDYNVGKTSYKPNLDLYPEKLAYQFTKQEMASEGFKFDFKQLENAFLPHAEEYSQIKSSSARQQFLNAVREQLSMNYKFTAGVLSTSTKNQINTSLATVWLSDDSLIKQIANRKGQDFTLEDYTLLPDVLYSPDKIVLDDNFHVKLYKWINNKRFLAVIKVLNATDEIYLQSLRLVSERQWDKAFR
ncbi:phage minor head protein [Pasteurella multocida]|nr:minor capsid protein [Pasteurella multocida]HDR1845908.1 minor capsid protein [Pasteurella multocida]